MATPQRWGTDIFVSGSAGGVEPQVAALADGRFIVTWYDDTAQDVRAQLLNADGSLSGGAFTVNSNPVGEQMHPNVTTLADGRFVVIWTDQSDPKYDNNNTGSGYAGWYADIFGQVFNIDGTKSGEPFKVNAGEDFPPTHAGHQPAITALRDGGFAVTWRDYLSPDEGSGSASAEVWLVRHDANGNQVLGPMLITSSTDYSNVEPVVQELDNGNLVVVWSQGTKTNEINLHMRVVRPDGTTDLEMEDMGAAYDGTPNVVQILPEVTKLKDGGFAVTWKVEDGSTGHHDYAVWARVFNENGTPRTDPFQISLPENVDVDPVVTALTDGRFMVTWADFNDYDTLATEVKSQVYTANGIKDGEAFTVPTPDLANDRMPSITTLEDGRVIVSWWHDGEHEIRAQIIDPREEGINLSSATQGSRTAFNNDWVGTGFADTLEGGQGNDQLEGGAGADILDGGEGFDIVAFSGATKGVVVNLLDQSKNAGDATGDTYVSIEGIAGSRHNDILMGNAAANVLKGNAGNDVLNGWTGADTMEGGAGNDTYYVHDAGDRVVEASTGGTADLVYTGISYTLAAYVENLTAAGSSSINLTGNTLANVIKGNAGANKIDGGLGADTLYGGAGSDTYYVNTASDRIVEASTGGTADRVYTSASYTLANYVEQLYASGSFSINLTGNSQANVIKGNAGANKINGGLGVDTLYGGSGKDIFVFNSKPSSSNYDKIADYSTTYDTIYLENAVFTRLKSGTLASSSFWKGSKAHDSDDRIIYDSTKGYLYYDADGTGATKQVLIATLSKGLKMTSAEFYVI